MILLNFLQDGQKIVYFKNGTQISELTPLLLANFQISPGLALHLRDYQPFVTVGDVLAIPLEKGCLRTSKITNIFRDGNSLIITTQNSKYKIEYQGINLEKVLADGRLKGCNDSGDKVTPAKFPVFQTVSDVVV